MFLLGARLDPLLCKSQDLAFRIFLVARLALAAVICSSSIVAKMASTKRPAAEVLRARARIRWIIGSARSESRCGGAQPQDCATNPSERLRSAGPGSCPNCNRHRGLRVRLGASDPPGHQWLSTGKAGTAYWSIRRGYQRGPAHPLALPPWGASRPPRQRWPAKQAGAEGCSSNRPAHEL